MLVFIPSLLPRVLRIGEDEVSVSCQTFLPPLYISVSILFAAAY
jgi:hypothetical protein